MTHQQVQFEKPAQASSRAEVEQQKTGNEADEQQGNGVDGRPMLVTNNSQSCIFWTRRSVQLEGRKPGLPILRRMPCESSTT